MAPRALSGSGAAAARRGARRLVLDCLRNALLLVLLLALSLFLLHPDRLVQGRRKYKQLFGGQEDDYEDDDGPVLRSGLGARAGAGVRVSNSAISAKAKQDDAEEVRLAKLAMSEIESESSSSSSSSSSAFHAGAAFSEFSDLPAVVSETSASEGGPVVDLKMFEFPGTEVCGAWHEAYVATHREVRSGRQAGGFLTWRSSGGNLGEQLLGLTSAFLAAFLTNRSIIIQERTFFGNFRRVNLDWTPGPVVTFEPMSQCTDARCEEAAGATIEEGTKTALSIKFTSLAAVDANGVGKFPADIVEFFGPLDKYANLIVESNAGVISRVFGSGSVTEKKLLAAGFKPATAMGCILRLLFSPRAPALELAMAGLARLKAAPNTVCVHVPASPAALEGDDGLPAKAELNCALNVGKASSTGKEKTTWLLALEALEVAKVWKSQVRGKHVDLQMTSMQMQSQSPTSLLFSTPSRYGVAEWLVFSTCHVYVMSDNDFMKAAYGYNLGEPRAFLLKKTVGETGSLQQACDPSRPSSLQDFQDL